MDLLSAKAALAMRYEARAAIAMGSVVLVGTIGFVGLRKAMAPPMRAFPLKESADSFLVRDPEFIRPDSATYAKFAADDEAWRREYADPRAFSESNGSIAPASVWHPSERHLLDDKVYMLSRAGRLDEAIAVLTDWVDRHPDDGVELLKLARMLNQAGHGDASVARYRQLLALNAARRR